MTKYWKKDGKYVKVSGAYAKCADCPCGADDCTLCSGDTPLNMSVTVAGFANGITCTDCNDANVEYICEQDAMNACKWEINPDVELCTDDGGGVIDIEEVSAEVFDDAGDTTLRVVVSDGDSQTVQWEKVIDPFDCETSHSLASGDIVIDTWQDCDASSASCTVENA